MVVYISIASFLGALVGTLAGTLLFSAIKGKMPAQIKQAVVSAVKRQGGAQASTDAQQRYNDWLFGAKKAGDA